MPPKRYRRIFLSILTAGTIILSCLLSACDLHEHEMAFAETVEATCSENGTKSHWYCKHCGKRFADENGEIELSETDLLISRKEHSYVTYRYDGNDHYRQCSVCDYIDEISRIKHMLTYSADENEHYQHCYCGYETPHEKHVPDENGRWLCKICKYGTPDYVLSADGSYYICNGATTAFKEMVKELVIPDEYEGKPVKEISERAFSNCNKLEKLTIGANVISIGANAFMYCENLNQVTLSEGLIEIQSDAFLNCKSLESIVLPSSVSVLGKGVFKSCSKLATVNIPAGVTAINSQCFYDCVALESIELPAGLKTMGLACFSRTALKEIVIPAGVDALPQTAFEGCSELTKITVPVSVKSMGTACLMNCPKLVQVDYLGTKAQWEAIDFWTSSPAWNLNSDNMVINYLG